MTAEPIDLVFVFAVMLATSLAAAHVIFVAALRRRDNSLADRWWGPGFVVLGIAAFAATPVPLSGASWLTLGLVAVWATRLALHISLRAKGKGEDPRYARWREEWGTHWRVRSWLQVFVLQSTLMAIAASPLLAAAVGGEVSIDWRHVLGVALWAAGLAIEAVADWQMRRHRRIPRAQRSRFLTTGLWGWSRHPNYFGEAVLWWGIALIASAGTFGWVAFVGAALTTLLVRFVSGVPLLERSWANDPEFSAWSQHTRTAFVLWPPRTSA